MLGSQEQLRSLRGPIGLPKVLAAGSGSGPEEQGVTRPGEFAGRGGGIPAWEKHKILDQGGAGRGAVALPQLGSGRAVVSREEQDAVQVEEGARALDPAPVVEDDSGLLPVDLQL